MKGIVSHQYMLSKAIMMLSDALSHVVCSNPRSQFKSLCLKDREVMKQY